MKAKLGLLLCAILVGCNQDRCGPVEQRMQDVFEVVCADGQPFKIYQPFNTIGIQFDQHGRRVSGIQACRAVHIGVVKGVGGQ